MLQGHLVWQGETRGLGVYREDRALLVGLNWMRTCSYCWAVSLFQLEE